MRAREKVEDAEVVQVVQDFSHQKEKERKIKVIACLQSIGNHKVNEQITFMTD